MSYSTQRAVSDGTLSVLPLSIEYFDRSEITVLFNGVLSTTGWNWVGTTDKVIQFVPDVPNGVEVMLVRSTDLAEVRHQFSLGAAFKAVNVDEDFKQVLHIAQEAKERATLTDLYSDVNLHGHKITSLAPGADAADAVTMAQHTAQAVTVQGLIDTANAAVATANAAVANIAGVVDSAGNLYVTKELKFTGVASKITGDFTTKPLRIKGSEGLSTQVTIEPSTTGSNTTLVLACDPNDVEDNLSLHSDVTYAAITAGSASPSDYQKNLMLNAGYLWPVQLVLNSGSTPAEMGFWFRGPRIFGDFSLSDLSKRMAFQSNAVNGSTNVGVSPNGTAVQAGVQVYNNSDMVNASTTELTVNAIASKVTAGKTGTGTYKPLVLNVGGADVATYSEAAATLGNMTASVNNASGQLTHSLSNTNASAAAGSVYKAISNAGTVTLSQTATAAGGVSYLLSNATAFSIGTGNTGTLYLLTNNAVAASIDNAGNIIAVKPTGGLGYGVGAGGTVTQTTSKSTAVTLNRPNGKITTFNDALAANTQAVFTFNNSLLVVGDRVSVWITDATGGRYNVWAYQVAAGSCVVSIKNITGASYSDPIAIEFAINKGSLS